MPGNLLIMLCSAVGAAVFLFLQRAVVPRRAPRLVLALAALLSAAVAPGYSGFDSRIFLFETGGLLAGWVIALALWRRDGVLRQWWAMADLVGVGAFLAAGLYSTGDRLANAGSERAPLQAIAVYLAIAAAAHLIHELGQSIVLQRPAGLTFAQTVAVTGILGLVFHGVDSASTLCLLAGLAILALRLRSFLSTKEEHRILEKISVAGEHLQAEYTPASLECPEPQLWSMFDSMTAEKEVLDLLHALVRALKPRVVVETGAFSGVSSVYIARALQENGRGRLITCEVDPVVYESARNRFRKENLESIIDCRLCSSFDLEVSDTIDLLYCDSDLEARVQEIRKFIGQINPFGLILMHDAGSHFKVVREGAAQLEKEGLISVVFVSTPRGLVIAQKREGRK